MHATPNKPTSGLSMIATNNVASSFFRKANVRSPPNNRGLYAEKFVPAILRRCHDICTPVILLLREFSRRERPASAPRNTDLVQDRMLA